MVTTFYNNQRDRDWPDESSKDVTKFTCQIVFPTNPVKSNSMENDDICLFNRARARAGKKEKVILFIANRNNIGNGIVFVEWKEKNST